MNLFVGWVGVVQIDEEVVPEWLHSWFIFLADEGFFHAIWLEIYENCLLRSEELAFLTVEFVSYFHYERTFVFVGDGLGFEISLFVVEEGNFEYFDELVEGAYSGPMLSKVVDAISGAVLLGHQWLARVCK